jgi:type IV secretory pathway VirB2 component (pilin)
MKIKKNVSKNLLTLLVLAVLFFSLIPGQVFSVSLVPCGGSGQDPCKLCHLFVLFDNIVKFVLFDIVPPIAILMVVIGGVMFFAAVGDPAKIGKATSLLTAVVIGLVIIYGAWLLINLFFSLIGVAEWTGLKEGWFKIDCPI